MTSSSSFQLYLLDDTDTVETVSEELYKSPLYYWVLLLVNDIVCPFTDWMQPSLNVQAFTEKKYEIGITQTLADGSERTFSQTLHLEREDPHINGVGLEGIHHFYDDTSGFICDDYDDLYYRAMWAANPTSIPENIIPVSNLEYEIDVNNSKRNIAIVELHELLSFVNDFSSVLSSSPKG